MKNAHEVLRQKEEDLVRVRKEVDSLRLIAPMLGDDGGSAGRDAASADDTSSDAHHGSEATGTDGPFSSASSSRPRFWNSLKRT
jgi:hypothetical protein